MDVSLKVKEHEEMSSKFLTDSNVYRCREGFFVLFSFFHFSTRKACVDIVLSLMLMKKNASVSLIQSGGIFPVAANTDAVLWKCSRKSVLEKSMVMLSREYQHKPNKTNAVHSLTRTKWISKKPLFPISPLYMTQTKRRNLFW